MDPEEKDLDTRLQERFKQLPKVVQDAITSADVEKRMRSLADTQKLHLDQWESLENEVMLALLGFQPVEDLQKNIKSEVDVSDEVAATLASEVSKLVFEPIREELEKQLATSNGASAMPAVLPATPPAPQNEEKAIRAPISESYKPGEVSNARKSVHDDPYREPPA
ncbi:MAG TPA: hypothetical protein VMH91_00975 [Candidatus Paceibacterota bacterium]|nr:hypothetical protein [Candidatus Paceibacterota bacterium]